MSRTVQAARRPRARVLRAVATLGTLAAIAADPALATQQRSFVASMGNDAAACSLTAPCRGFTAAIAKTNAGGEVIALDSAGYGAVTITKSISLIAPAGVYAGITVASGDGVTIDAPGATVVLRGLAINGLGGTFGVRVHAADRVRIENCVISNMAQDGIHHEAPGAEVAVVDTIVRDNGNFGINLIADASIVLDHVRSEHNDTSGLHVGPVSTSATAAVADSVFSGNGVNGIVAFAGTGQAVHMQVDRSLIANNASNGVVATGASGFVGVGIAGNGISHNGADGVLLSGTSDVRGAVSGNTVTGNGGNGLHVTGTVLVNATGNTMATNLIDFACDGGGLITSIGNNSGGTWSYSPSTCHSVGPGQ